MKKMLKLLAMITLGGVLVVAGALAATSATHTSTLTVKYIANHAAVEIKYGIGTASTTEYTYNNDYQTAADNQYVLTWAAGTLEFTTKEQTIVLAFQFTNNGSKTVNIDLATPEAGTNTAVEFTPAWTNSSGGTITNGSNVANGVTINCKITVKIPDATYSSVVDKSDTFSSGTSVILFTINVVGL